MIINKLNNLVFSSKKSNFSLSQLLTKSWKKILFPLMGLGSLIWFLVRVIPKPTRATYPCMRIAAPMASSFVIWLLSLAASISAFSWMKSSLANSAYFRAFLFLIASIGFGLIAFTQDGLFSYADSNKNPLFIQSNVEPNNPVGSGVGIFPGRVVWVHDPDATNENCDPKEYPNSYFMPGNNDQEVIDAMVSSAIQKLTGTTSDSQAWKEIFKFHNNSRGKGPIGYTSGEIIFLKINQTSTWGSGEFWDNWNKEDLSARNSGSYGMSESSPAFVLAVLRQLINIVGINQSDIYVGDPMKHTYKHLYDLWHSEFPDVHYLDNSGYTNLGREIAEKSTTAKIEYSDKGSVLNKDGTPIFEDYLYKIFEEMEYMINLPQMKGHERGGVTMFAKNHFGSHTRPSASHLHDGLVVENDGDSRPGYGLYRVQVDIMGHKYLGKKNLIYLMDALWATFYELYEPMKWQIPPFNNDWTSSIFASFDPVAIESVGYDFIRSEYTTDRYTLSMMGEKDFNRIKVIQMDGVDDYLVQAANPDSWPDGIQYDPENDGSIISSLGVHEHWNDPINKEYSRNLGTGEGIELIKVSKSELVLEIPTELSAELIDGMDIVLTWKDNSNEEAGFIIERKIFEFDNHFHVLDTTLANQNSYTDTTQKLTGNYHYRVKAFNDYLESEYTDSVSVSVIVGNINNDKLNNGFALNQNYPNPFNPSTRISFSLNQKADIMLKIFDVMGNEILTLMDETKSSGSYDIMWDGTDFRGNKVVSGIYIYRLAVESNSGILSASKKMTLIK